MLKYILLAVAAAVLVMFPARAHHSFAADFDGNKPVHLEGTVVKFEFMNPHSWIHIDVKEADGKLARWSIETGSTNALFRRGWRKDSLREGDPVVIDGYRAKNGSNTANASTVKLPDGRQVNAASSRESAK